MGDLCGSVHPALQAFRIPAVSRFGLIQALLKNSASVAIKSGKGRATLEMKVKSNYFTIGTGRDGS
jgi:hypothetical protein